MAERSQILANAVTQAIMTQALLPGTKLGERELAEACKTSRAVVKQALLIVGQSELVEIKPHAGASVAQLTIHDAYELFDALITLEQGVIFQLVERLSSGEWKILDEHVVQTQTYIDDGNEALADETGPEFHSLLVSLLRNKSVSELHARLVRRSTLLRALYVNKQYHRCRLNDEHAQLVVLMQNGQTIKAAALIEDHYRSVVRGFDMHSANPEPCDLKSAIAPLLAL